MNHSDSFPQRQLRSLCTAALLSPILRLIPGSAAPLAGRAAWAGPLAALPLLLAYGWLLGRVRGDMLPGEALPELCLRALGKPLGRLILLGLSAWLLLYGGFVLRSGAERFLVTVYPRATAPFFVVSMGLLGLLAALGPLQSLLRAARMAVPVLLGVLLLILLAALGSLDKTELLPLTLSDAGALLRGAFPALDLLAFGLAAFCFFRPGGEEAPGLFGRTALWIGEMALLLTAVGAAVQGRFGAALSARLSAPFFALVRNLVFFRSLERMEALVVGLWIVPDFLLTGLVLHGAQRCLRQAVGLPPKPGERRLELSGGRWLIGLCGAIVIGLGLLLGPDPASLQLWSRAIIPLLNLFAAALIPAIWLIGRLQKKL